MVDVDLWFFASSIFVFFSDSICSSEKPVKWSWLPHLLQWITTFSKPCLLTFVPWMEYASSVQSSGEIITPHCGHGKAPFPSMLAKSILYAWVCFNLVAYLWFFQLENLGVKGFKPFFRFMPKSLPNLAMMKCLALGVFFLRHKLLCLLLSKAKNAWARIALI